MSFPPKITVVFQWIICNPIFYWKIVRGFQWHLSPCDPSLLIRQLHWILIGLLPSRNGMLTPRGQTATRKWAKWHLFSNRITISELEFDTNFTFQNQVKNGLLTNSSRLVFESLHEKIEGHTTTECVWKIQNLTKWKSFKKIKFFMINIKSKSIYINQFKISRRCRI